MIARQTVHVNLPTLISLLNSQGIHTTDDQLSKLEFDRHTRIAQATMDREFIMDRSLFSLLGSANVRALDHSDFEGADIIHDLRNPLPEHLSSIADFIVDGSTLDNVFDPALAIRSFAKMLRPGGRYIGINLLAPHGTAYTITTPLWYLDYFAANNFADCRIYLLNHFSDGSTLVLDIDFEALRGNPAVLYEMRTFVTPSTMGVLAFAEKGSASTSDAVPNQADYRPDAEWEIYNQALARFAKSGRPELTRSDVATYPNIPPGIKVIEKR